MIQTDSLRLHRFESSIMVKVDWNMPLFNFEPIRLMSNMVWSYLYE